MSEQPPAFSTPLPASPPASDRELAAITKGIPAIRRPSRLVLAIATLSVIVARFSVLLATIAIVWSAYCLLAGSDQFDFFSHEIVNRLGMLLLAIYLMLIGMRSSNGNRDVRWHYLWYSVLSFAVVVVAIVQSVFPFRSELELQNLDDMKSWSVIELAYPAFLLLAMNLPSIRRLYDVPAGRLGAAPPSTTAAFAPEQARSPVHMLRYARGTPAATAAPRVIVNLGMVTFLAAWIQLRGCLSALLEPMSIPFINIDERILGAVLVGLALYLFVIGVLLIRNRPTARLNLICCCLLRLAVFFVVYALMLRIVAASPANSSSIRIPAHFVRTLAERCARNCSTPLLMLALAFFPRVREHYRSIHR